MSAELKARKQRQTSCFSSGCGSLLSSLGLEHLGRGPLLVSSEPIDHSGPNSTETGPRHLGHAKGAIADCSGVQHTHITHLQVQRLVVEAAVGKGAEGGSSFLRLRQLHQRHCVRGG